MGERKILIKMVKQVILLFFIVYCLPGCNTSSRYFSQNSPSCSGYLELEKEAEVFFIKNKEFKEISNLLKKEHKATIIRNIVYFKSKNMFYCEFYTNRDTVLCLFLDDDKKVISKENVEFDY